MISYWLTFTDKSQGCCQGESTYDAKVIAEKLTGKTVGGGMFQDITAQVLPYPADPVIWQLDHPKWGKCPTFCYSPKQCAGRTSCPKPRACSE